MIDRRQLLLGLVSGVAGAVLPRRAAAQETSGPAGVVRVGNRLSLVTAGRTNVLALSASGGLVIVDSGAPESADRLMDALRQLSSGGRVATAFNTHFHVEHTGANELLRQAGAELLAHENTRLWMATPTWLPAEDRYRPARPKAAQPTKTFYAEGSMSAEGERIDYGYLIEAHTSGDIYVYFRDSNVIAAGDVLSPERDPELDYLTGAWIGGRVDAMTRLLALGNDETRFVPGVGPVMTRAQLRAERDMMKTIYDRAVDRVREGDSADDMLKGGVLGGLPRTLKDPRRFLYDVNKGLWAHHNKLNANVV